MSLNDTIAAISTPIGEGGIGIVRLSGKDSINLAERIFKSPHNKSLSEAKSHSITYGFVADPETGNTVDEALFTVMRAPKTYTREDIVEINCHGGIIPLRHTLSLLLKNGARLAEAGEFTKRAFLNGRIDLSQAEAVIDIIRSKTASAERIALKQLEGKLSDKIKGLTEKIITICANVEAYIDFPEDEVEEIKSDELLQRINNLKESLRELAESYEEGRFFKEGVSTAIVGKPNVGKSSLLNALLEKDRAIVTEYPGTTRDIIEDYLNINGLPLRIMDTAGIRESRELVEKEGVLRSLRTIENSDIVLAVFDLSAPLDILDMEVLQKIKNKKSLIILNKLDIQNAQFNVAEMGITEEECIKISALKGWGIEELKRRIYSLCLTGAETGEMKDILISNVRHRDAIEKAIKPLDEAENLLQRNEPLEIIAVLLREAANSLGEITGTTVSETVLDKIFREFCIGK
jgi:tRNA modification GTPase